MARAAHVHDSLDRLEGSILPSLAGLLDGLIEAAALARPGQDAEAYAGEIRGLADQLDSVTRQVEDLCGDRFPAYPAAAA
jgi:hypothetical protein